MLSFPDIAILSGIALVIFGPERLPGIAHQVGQAIGTLRSTAYAFTREMERATIVPPPSATPPTEPPITDSVSNEIRSGDLK